MNKVSFLVFVALLLTIEAAAREVQGFYINLTGDTSKVIFDIPIVAPNVPLIRSLHFEIMFLDKNQIERTLKPHQAREVCFTYNNITTRLLARADQLNLARTMFKKNKSYVFLKLEVDGKLQLFSFYHTQHVSMDFSYESQMTIFQKDNGLLFIPNNYRFRHSVRKYLKDCPELVKRLKRKLYGKGDEVEIAEYYNEYCWAKA